MNKYENLKYIFANIIGLLLIAQFDFTMTNNIGISIFTAFFIILIFIYNKYLNKSIFVFIILVLISSFFSINFIFGHTFAAAAFFVILIAYLSNTNLKEIKVKDNLLNFLFFVFILFNVLGWIFKSIIKYYYLVTSIMFFFSLLMIFIVASKIKWNQKRYSIFISIMGIMIIYALITALLAPFHVNIIKTPLLGLIETEFSAEGTFFYSMLDRPTTAVGAMFAVFLLPFYLFKYKIKHSNKNLILVSLLSSLLVCLLGFSKSHSVVLLIGVILTLILSNYVFSLRTKVIVNMVVLILLFGILYNVTDTFFNFSFLQKRFEKQPNFFQNLMKNPFTGKGTSRSDSFQMGLDSLGRENWMIGYGYANGSQNRLAWLGKDLYTYPKLDFHNLYYSLPQLYGWIGAFVYIMIYLITIVRLRKVFKDRRVSFQYRILSFSFFLFWVVHLMTEYSIVSITSSHYMLMIFILLGISNSLYYNYKLHLLDNK